MAIVSTPNNFFCQKHFIFNENLIIVKKTDPLPQTLTADCLPDEETVRKCLKLQTVSDWYAEPDYDYSAFMLENDSPIPAGCMAIPLRQFFSLTEACSTGLPSQQSLTALSSRAHGFLRLRQQYRYCPKCGGLLQDDDIQTAKRCTSCGTLHFPRIEPCVIVLVTKGDQILLVKSKNRTGSWYSCVAGFIEHGETAEQCVAREVKEETNLEIQNIRYVTSQSWPFPDQLMLGFTAEYKSGNIVPQTEELDEATWFSIHDLPELPGEGSVANNLIRIIVEQKKAEGL